MNKVRITAIRQTVYLDLIDLYENHIEHACTIRQGQQWISIDGKCPDGLCPSAWESMQSFVDSLARGKGNFFDGWMKNPMSAMISCNDGFRPFSFYIEVIEEQKPGTSSRPTGWRSQLTFGFERQEQRGASLQPDTASVEKGKTQRLLPKDRVEARVFKFVLVVGKKVLPRRQIIADLGMRQQSRHTFINNYWRPAWERGLIDLAYPTVPHKPEQAYRLTAKGLELYAQLTGEEDIIA